MNTTFVIAMFCTFDTMEKTRENFFYFAGAVHVNHRNDCINNLDQLIGNSLHNLCIFIKLLRTFDLP